MIRASARTSLAEAPVAGGVSWPNALRGSGLVWTAPGANPKRLIVRPVCLEEECQRGILLRRQARSQAVRGSQNSDLRRHFVDRVVRSEQSGENFPGLLESGSARDPRQP